MYLVEKNIQMPNGGRLGRKSKYPFAEMEVGDSFFIPGSGEDVRLRVANAAMVHGKRNGKTFTSRKVDGGFRLWRSA